MSGTEPEGGLAGIVLTGGASRRMGRDKATLHVGGIALAHRVATLLEAVASPVIEVGPGSSGRRSVRESPPGSGPLAALVAGARELRRLGTRTAVLVCACDLARLELGVLETLATFPGGNSIVPIVAGHPQLLCARWSAADLDVAARLVASGATSMRALLAATTAVLSDPTTWSPPVPPLVFADVDTPEDLAALGNGLAMG